MIIAIQAYRKQFKAKPTGERENLKIHLRMNQKLAAEVLVLLKNKIDLGYGNDVLWGHITIAKYYELAESEFEKSLNDEFFDDIETFDKHHIDSALKSLQTQFENLQNVRNYLKSL